MSDEMKESVITDEEATVWLPILILYLKEVQLFLEMIWYEDETESNMVMKKI